MFQKISLDTLFELENNINKSLIAKQNYKTERLKSILGKHSSGVSRAEVEEFVYLLSEIRFFQERKDIKKRDLKELMSAFKIVETKHNQNVVNYGEPGENFYIIISGQVSVQIPNPRIKDWSSHKEKFAQL